MRAESSIFVLAQREREEVERERGKTKGFSLLLSVACKEPISPANYFFFSFFCGGIYFIAKKNLKIHQNHFFLQKSKCPPLGDEAVAS